MLPMLKVIPPLASERLIGLIATLNCPLLDAEKVGTVSVVTPFHVNEALVAEKVVRAGLPLRASVKVPVMLNGEDAPPGRMSVVGEPTVSEPMPAELSDPDTARLVNSPGTVRLPLVTERLAELGVTAMVNVPPTLHPSNPNLPPPLTVSDIDPVAPLPASVSGCGVATVRVWPRKLKV